jgi:hypothetical protein
LVPTHSNLHEKVYNDICLSEPDQVKRAPLTKDLDEHFAIIKDIQNNELSIDAFKKIFTMFVEIFNKHKKNESENLKKSNNDSKSTELLVLPNGVKKMFM